MKEYKDSKRNLRNFTGFHLQDQSLEIQNLSKKLFPKLKKEDMSLKNQDQHLTRIGSEIGKKNQKTRR